MKKTIKTLTLIVGVVLVGALAFTFTACDNGDDTSDDDTSAELSSAWFEKIDDTAYRVVRHPDYKKPPNQVVIPATYKGKPVTAIGDDAFSFYPNLTSVSIPDSVTSIGNSAFYGCTGLTRINHPRVSALDFKLYIGRSAFLNCTSLTSVVIPFSEITIDIRTFEGCTSLTRINIGYVTSIDPSAFYGCTSLTSITVDRDNRNYTSEGGILYNKGKTAPVLVPEGISGEVTIPASVSYILREMFDLCTKLTGIRVGSGNSNYTSEGGILYNKGKTDIVIVPRGISGAVTIPDSVASISDFEFSGCTKLTSITIPDSVASISGLAFKGCFSLTVITIGSGNPNYTSEGGILYDKTRTELICYPSATGSVTIPAGVTFIGGGAFFGCTNLTSVTIGKSVTKILESAFMGCPNLTRVTFEGSVTIINSFDGGLSKFINESDVIPPGTYTTTAPVSWDSVWVKQQ
jgi:hypothetical protein